MRRTVLPMMCRPVAPRQWICRQGSRPNYLQGKANASASGGATAAALCAAARKEQNAAGVPTILRAGPARVESTYDPTLPGSKKPTEVLGALGRPYLGDVSPKQDKTASPRRYGAAPVSYLPYRPTEYRRRYGTVPQAQLSWAANSAGILEMSSQYPAWVSSSSSALST